MPSKSIVFRCDGDERLGCGHVARCLPLARAFADRGWQVRFVGRYGGLADGLLAQAQIETMGPRPGAPLGIGVGEWTAAVVDLYGADPAELCELAERLPVATLAESTACAHAGVVIDYHADRRPEESSSRLLAGPCYAPIDPRFAGLGRPGDTPERALVTLGGTCEANKLAPAVCDALEQAFPGVRIACPGSADERARRSLLDAIANADLAVSSAGVTAYELACAGIPSVIVAVAENQRRVANACQRAGLAIGIDAFDAGRTDALRANSPPTSDAPLELLPAALRALGDAALRRRMAANGRATFDGRGATRTAGGLESLWQRSPYKPLVRAPCGRPRTA